MQTVALSTIYDSSEQLLTENYCPFLPSILMGLRGITHEKNLKVIYARRWVFVHPKHIIAHV
jgi:hypothetical protein